MDWGLGVDRVFYDAEVAWRYVMIKPLSLVSDQLDVMRLSNDTNLVVLDGRESSRPFNGHIMATHRVTFSVPAVGTCTTPFVNQGTVHFGGLYPTDFPNNQWGEAATRNFTLTFSNCPRVNIKYYVHANGNRWVDSARGVVGVQGSVPGASDPVTGNPRGFAVQLQHRSGGHQHTGGVYIHPNEVANPLSLPDTQAYTRNWQGEGTSNSSTGVTHTIPMRARLVRTGHSSQQQIQLGPFNTSVIVAIQYP